MNLMEFVINLAVNGNAAAQDLQNVANKADDAGEKMAALEKRAHLAGQRIGDGMKSAVKSFVALGAAAAAAGVGLFKLAKSTADEIDEMGDFGDKNNIGIEALQELSYAAQKAGADKEALRSSVSGLNKVMGESALGIGKGAKMMAAFGLSARNSDGSIKSVDEMMGDVSDRMKDMSRQEAIAMASKLGIDTDLVPMLQSGSKEIENLRSKARSLGVITEEQAQKTAEFTSQMEDMNQTFSYLSAIIGSEVAPVISKLIRDFIDSQGGIEGLKVKAQEFAQKLAVVLPQIAKVAAAFGTVVIAGAKLLDWLAQASGGWDNFAYVLVGVKALTGSGLLMPLINGLPSLGSGFMSLARIGITAFRMLGAAMLSNPIAIVVAAIVAGAYLVWTNWDKIVGWLKTAWGSVGEFFSGVIDKMMGWWNDFKDSFMRGINWVIDKVNYLPGVNIDQVGGGGTGSSAQPVTSQNHGAGGSWVNNVTVNATTPQAVDRAVSPNFARQTATAGYGGTW